MADDVGNKRTTTLITHLSTAQPKYFPRYDDGFEVGSATVRHFWKAVHSFGEEEKRLLLKFSTGSDRAPINGLASMKFVISRNGPDSDRLPTSHTCFNHLLLPEYSSYEKTEEKLICAIRQSEGFGLR